MNVAMLLRAAPSVASRMRVIPNAASPPFAGTEKCCAENGEAPLGGARWRFVERDDRGVEGVESDARRLVGRERGGVDEIVEHRARRRPARDARLLAEHARRD